MLELKPIHMPDRIVPQVEEDRYGKFLITPLERGWGTTIGNSMRRALLSVIQGSAIVQVRIENVLHEFSTIRGVLEEVPQIILNLKKTRVKLLAPEPRTLYLHAKGKGEYYARDIEQNPEVEILTPDQHLFTITDGKASVNMEMVVDSGRGYVPAEQHKVPEAMIGTIFLDALFSPVLKVNFTVENTRVEQRTDYDQLTLEVWTDGSISPRDAVVQAATVLSKHIEKFIELGTPPEVKGVERVDEETLKLRDLLSRPIDELEISVRASHCLRDENIKTIGELVARTEREMLEIKNFGKKSLEELRKVLENIGLHFGMDVDRIMGVK
ncbi:DNA-directed RNA polymerase subunit alpha [candidate division WOR-3 bacterium]|uniref:DNA-directed RNA polymerase subunit alpha n=1 Tax=candidate division WOR-3 bacterium TaxID=2052148 RepID=A0A660SEH1_UNCW3|nr:MAG: DNA-directed RNA polymerase subunit alpha [candidate division WOR-3 bacterium]